LIELIDKHNHPSEKEKVEVRQFREKVKQRAMHKTTPVPRIYEEECAKTKQSRGIAIQRRINNLNMRYYDSLITPMEYSDGLSFVAAKRKECRFFFFFGLTCA
jgi:hypothetical protein